MILSAKINDSLTAEFSMDFTTGTWSLPPAAARWGGVMFSDRGPLEVKPWGVVWLMDGLGSAKKDSTIILHNGPTSEKDMAHVSGGGCVFAPAKSSYKDSSLQWNVLRLAAPPELAAAATSGVPTRIRIRAKKLAEGLLPKPGKLSNGKPEPGATGTGCGEFPGRIMRRMPVLGPPFRGAFEIDVQGTGKLHLTSPTTWWEEMAQAIDQKYKPAKKTWVPFTGSNRPSTGDIYLLSQYENKGMFQHVGMIISAEGSEWVTADGGQGNGWQSGFITRKFHANGQIDGEKGNKAWVKGWVDLDNLRDALKQYFPADV